MEYSPIRDQLQARLHAAAAGAFPEFAITHIVLERPKQAQHGDYATNLALQLAKPLRQNPREAAQKLIAALEQTDLLERVEVAGPGFINLTLLPSARQRVVHEIYAAGDCYGRGSQGGGRKVMVEFVSANPTGLLHVGHGRGAVVGDALASLLEWDGWEAHREFYYNDAGAQIINLALSVQSRIRERHEANVAFPEDGYRGNDIREVAERYVAAHPEDAKGEDLNAIRRFAVNALREEQDRDLAALGVHFDCHYLESSLYSEGRVAAVVEQLAANGMSYEREGALWLKTTQFGDDKDRVMRKSDGAYTYFVPDVAYHVTKWLRGFTRAVNEQGGDHHSTVTRVRAGLQALGLGIPPGYPEYVLHQMVTVMRGGEEVKLSKRTGTSVTIRELVEEVGRDAFRFLFLMRKHDSQLTFDVDLARAQSDENPVYYVQYAHARICSVMRQGGIAPGEVAEADLSPLVSPYETVLLRRLTDFPEVVTAAARDLAPHAIPFYLKDLAADFHSYYNAEQFLVADAPLRNARLALVCATGQVLKNGLAIVGVSAPEQM